MTLFERVRYAPYIRRFFSLVKNLRKGKFKSLYRRYTDPKYAADIHYLWRITEEFELTVTSSYMPIYMINHSHDLNYPKWADYLTDLIKAKKSLSDLEPIKVIFDRFKNQWTIVDGNHRFNAIKRNFCPLTRIPVRVLHPKGTVVESVIHELETPKYFLEGEYAVQSRG